MKKIVIVRHGEADARRPWQEPRLTPVGREAAQMLGVELRQCVNGGRVAVIASPAVRAEETAKVLGELLCCQHESTDLLYSDVNRHADLAGRVLPFLERVGEGCDTLVLVTHLELTETLPFAIGRHFGGHDHFPCEVLKHGHAYVLDLETDAYEHIVPWTLPCVGEVA